MDMKKQFDLEGIKKLYSAPLPSHRNGVLYNAFSYPTKISPEAIALFIACHTQSGATILDPFGGSGTTGLAAKLCDNPTQHMMEIAQSLGLEPKWGKRNAVLYELSTLGAFVGDTMCNPPDSIGFERYARQLLKETENELQGIYNVKDNDGKDGIVRYIIWSEILVCPNCQTSFSFWDIAVVQEPLAIVPEFICPHCGHVDSMHKIPRVTENSWDDVLESDHISKKRIPVKIYGQTGKKTWSREATAEDIKHLNETFSTIELQMPAIEFKWGGLYRKGYHTGITHLHHFYTRRNAFVFSTLWRKIEAIPQAYQKALQLLLLSYNSSHSTLMTRVVVKQNNTDFVVTGAQSGVLYISNLPVEKNIFEGVRRKIKTLSKAFELMEASGSEVRVYNASSTQIDLPEASIDYVFTDPPFGDYIPYSELNQLNELWLGTLTDQRYEAIVDATQGKGIAEYAELMQQIFIQISKVLKPLGTMSLVFHSAKAEIWRTLIGAYQQAGLKVETSSILDKIQGSFKQVISQVKVQGDPLLLLSKSTEQKQSAMDLGNETELINKIIEKAFVLTNDLEEQKPERLFSRYINACLESGKLVLLDAKTFYQLIAQRLANYKRSA
jgi:16S rRNA G966 N2-methylase RsmD